jgi:hypothetical protein
MIHPFANIPQLQTARAVAYKMMNLDQFLAVTREAAFMQEMNEQLSSTLENQIMQFQMLLLQQEKQLRQLEQLVFANPQKQVSETACACVTG